MNKATEDQLGALHGVVAKILLDQLEAKATIIGEDGEPVEMSMATPQVIAQAIKFLKDNNVTAIMEVGDGMDNLKDILSQKQKKGRAQLAAVPAKAAAAE